MVKSCGGAVFDAEVIDYKGKLDAVGCVGEKTWDIWMLEVALSGEVLDKMLVGEVRGLGESVHAFVDLEQDGVVTEESMKIVLGENVVWYKFTRYGETYSGRSRSVPRKKSMISRLANLVSVPWLRRSETTE